MINIGIIGTNWGLQSHLPAFRANNMCQVFGITAKDPVKTKQLATNHIIQKSYDNWQELIADPKIDAVSVAVPPHQQTTIIAHALKLQKPVFAEKPLSTDLEQAKILANLAANNNIPNMINFSFIASPALIEAKKLISQGFFSKIRYININWQLETRSSLNNLNTWKTDPNLGGGAWFNFASHVLFYVEWLIGQRIQSITVEKRSLISEQPGEHLVKVSGKIGDAVLQILICTAAFMGSGHKIEIYGENQSMIMENYSDRMITGFELKIAERSNEVSDTPWKKLTPEFRVPEFLSDDRIFASSFLVNKFIDWIQTGRKHQPNFEDGLRVQALLEKEG